MRAESGRGSNPREARFAVRSSTDSSNDMNTPGSLYRRAPLIKNSIPRIVLPLPGPPQTSVGRPRGSPPPVISSRPWIPVGDLGTKLGRAGCCAVLGLMDACRSGSSGFLSTPRTLERGVTRPYLDLTASCGAGRGACLVKLSPSENTSKKITGDFEVADRCHVARSGLSGLSGTSPHSDPRSVRPLPETRTGTRRRPGSAAGRRRGPRCDRRWWEGSGS